VICQNCIKFIFLFFSNVAGDDTKDAIIYSVVGSVIVIGIVAALSIFYYRRRRHQHISERESSDDLNLASHMELENPDESDL
jgi:Na+/melibiose symporter-like transporter